MYRFRRKIAALLAAVVILTTNLGVQLLPQNIRSTAENYLSPVASAASSSIKAAVNAGGGHALAVKNDGTVSCWGDNTYGELGDGTKSDKLSPVNVRGIDDVVAVSSVDDTSYAVKSDGTVWKWGMVEPYIPAGTPVKVAGLQDIVDIKASKNIYEVNDIFYLALKSDGTVWSWGDNSCGQLGNGSKVTNYTPTQVPDLYNVIAIATGNNFSVALKSDGTVWSWGLNYSYGQLGNGNTDSSCTPAKVPGLSDITDIAAGGSHALALKKDGTVFGWGDKEAYSTSSNLLSQTKIE
ncbi:MAG TPA: hypothetical protein VHT34_10240, partial [Clostridia bacterium]|nr:hypothetical protein [Clostridia bacterium]